jgi:hypothetical protein
MRRYTPLHRIKRLLHSGLPRHVGEDTSFFRNCPS